MSKLKITALSGTVAFLLVIGVWGKQAMTQSRLEYSIEVPADLPQEILLHNKDNTSYTASGHELYKARHRSGWNECLQDFRDGQLTTNSQPSIKAQFNIEANAERAGYHECKRKLFELIDAHGTLVVRIANR